MENQHIGKNPNGKVQLPATKNAVDFTLPQIEQETNASTPAIDKGISDIKNPEGDLLSPASMPADQQGEAMPKQQHHDLEGQQAGTNGGGREAR